MIFIGQFKISLAQKEKRMKPFREKGDLNCVHRNRYSATQRIKFYPFDIADTIKLVSFRYHRKDYPVKQDTLITDSLVEIKILTKTQIDSLTDILYNNLYKSQPNYGVITQCFAPRNSIVFFDRKGVKEYILLCFHCDNYKESSDKVRWGSECTQKMEKLRRLFISVGVKFGTDRTVDLYPGETSDEGIVAPPLIK